MTQALLFPLTVTTGDTVCTNCEGVFHSVRYLAMLFPHVNHKFSKTRLERANAPFVSVKIFFLEWPRALGLLIESDDQRLRCTFLGHLNVIGCDSLDQWSAVSAQLA